MSFTCLHWCSLAPLLFCLFTVLFSLVISSEDVCKMQCSSPMKMNCTEADGRCCINKTLANTTHTVIGVDLHGCNISNIAGFFIGLTELQIIYLEENPLKSISVEDFPGILKLEYMSLPGELQCPGTWEIEDHGPNNITECRIEESFCNSTNVPCPKNSYCNDTGLGTRDCLCLPDYHGYKCLNKGKFPTLAFVLGTSISTVLICGVLWFTQRRGIKTE
ncbi:hypothetical protein ScPMuIL_000740 [Solemya velum]